MTPSLRRELLEIKQRGWRTADDDPVFISQPDADRPLDDSELRAAFREAIERASLKIIPMYNTRHSFGTALASKGVPPRTIQGLMRHSRESTTAMYMAYSPQPDLERTMIGALEGPETVETSLAETVAGALEVDAVLAALEDEIPPKWLREVERVLGEMRTRAVAA